MLNTIAKLRWALGLAVIAASLSACSNTNPVDSQSLTLRGGAGSTMHEVEFGSRVATIDAGTRTLTFTGNNEVGVAVEDAEIVRRSENGVETPIDFGEIQVGDSVEVRGNRQDDGSVLLDRIRVRADQDDNEDVEFDGVITGIDVANSSLTVANRAETILVDSNTVIFGRSPDHHVSASGEGDDDDNSGDDDEGEFRGDTLLTLADLAIGDSIEVHALIIDSATLLATLIEVEDGAFEDEGAAQVEFRDGVATLDTLTRTITFLTQPWVGIVAENADLRDLNENIIPLADFFACQMVEVRGFVISGDTIAVVRMEMENF
jgi:hypothetical protein